MKQQTFDFENLKEENEAKKSRSATDGSILDIKASQSCNDFEDWLQPSPFGKKEEYSGVDTDDAKFIAFKCSCRSTWCPDCFRQSQAPKIANRLITFDWQRVRQIVLTIDRKQFKDGKEAYEHMKSKKAIAQLIHNLKRTIGIDVEDWIWVIEWHKDGFPHWHLFVQVQKKGAHGRIHFSNIEKYWQYGHVKESFYRSEKHWKNLTGYLHKTGYFGKEKGHQNQLPDWAQADNKTIRRYDSQHKKAAKKIDSESKGNDNASKEDEGNNTENKEPEKKRTRQKQERRTYREILEKCGKQTIVQIERGNGFFAWETLQLPYKEFKELLPGEYVPGEGYIVTMKEETFFEIIDKYLVK